MTDEQRHNRVLLAKDVIQQIKSGCQTAITGTYLMPNTNWDALEGESAQPHINRIAKECPGCALGNLFLSYARLFNNVKVNEMRGLSSSIIFKKLQEIFDYNTLRAIEETFELYGHLKNEIAYRAGLRLCREGNGLDERLLAIMQNIVDNDGEYVPEKIFEEAIQ